jgi:7-cyano-7-deazaguanine synthase in queuosine biosynthesis
MTQFKRYRVVVELGRPESANLVRQDPSGVLAAIDFLNQDRTVKNRYGGGALRGLSKIGLRPSETALDLLFLAAAVYISDTRINRKLHAQDGWTREIDLYLPVANPDLWDSNVVDLIQKALRFLTGDIWQVNFRPRPRGRARLVNRIGSLPFFKPDCVSLFSGGLDSFIGAVDLIENERNPLLVGHYYSGSDSKPQDRSFELIKRTYHIKNSQRQQVFLGADSKDIVAGGVEKTQRSRSFLFLGIGSLFADSIEGVTSLNVAENGLISLNVPLDPLRVGALSTRTTHPFFMTLFQDLLSRLDLSVKLEIPYRFMTKGEMIAACSNTKIIKENGGVTMSCSSPNKYRYNLKITDIHCGHCIPCIIRRAAFNKALGYDPTNYILKDHDLRGRSLDSDAAEGKDIRSFQYMLTRLRSNPDLARRLILKPGPIPDSFDHLKDYVRVFERGLAEVETFLSGIETKPL